MNSLLRKLLLAAGILVAGQAAAQVTFYENDGFHGRSFTADRTIFNFDRLGYNDLASSAIVRVPTGGGAPAVLASGVLVSSLTSDVGSLYWTEALSGDVMKMDKTGSVPSPVVGNAQATQAPHGIAVDGTSVYWIANTGVITIRRAPLGGGAPVDLVTAPSLVFAIAIDSTHLYWTTQAGLFSANLDGTNVAEIAAPGPIASLGVVDETVYWGRDDDVYATALDGSSLSIAHFASTVEADVALDSTSIYLSTSEPILRRVSLDGKTSEKLAPALAHHIALNSTHVFWTDILLGGVGVIMATPK